MSFFFTCVFVILMLFRPQEWLIPSLVPSGFLDFMVLAALLMILVETIRGKLIWPRNYPHLWLMLGFYGACLLSSAVMINFTNMYSTATTVGKLVIAFLLVALSCDNPKRNHTLYVVIVTIATLVSIHCWMQALLGWGFVGYEPLYMRGLEGDTYLRARFFGIIGDPNDTALFLTISMPLIFSIFRRRDGLTTMFTVALLGLMLGAVYFTQSRGGFIATMVMVLCVVAQYLSLRRTLLLGTVLLIVFVLAAPGRMSIGVSSQERTVLWGEANQSFKARPFTGVGVGRINEYLSSGKVPHNTFVHIYAETGIIGYFFWFALVMLSVVGCYRISNMVPDTLEDRYLIGLARGLIPSLVGLCAAGFFLSRAYFLPLYILLGLAGSIYVQAGCRVGMEPLNHWCGVQKRLAWLYPSLTVGSIFAIYAFILLANRVL